MQTTTVIQMKIRQNNMEISMECMQLFCSDRCRASTARLTNVQYIEYYTKSCQLCLHVYLEDRRIKKRFLELVSVHL